MLSQLKYIFARSDCILECMNGGTLNNESCTCDCPSIYSGDMCESKLIKRLYVLIRVIFAKLIYFYINCIQYIYTQSICMYVCS